MGVQPFIMSGKKSGFHPDENLVLKILDFTIQFVSC